jgi:hypothetical protein
LHGQFALRIRLIDPHYDTQELFQARFQLVCCSFAIMTTVRPLRHLLYRPFAVDPFLPPQLLPHWQRIWQGNAPELRALQSLGRLLGCDRPVLILQEHCIDI